MKDKFQKYLISQGYKEFTPSGKPSTVYDYIMRIDKICEWENTNWDELARNACSLLPEYEKGGAKQDLGAKSHNAVRSALRCFVQFTTMR